jgi:ribonuclease HII
VSRLARFDDRYARRRQVMHLAGVDEVGRGCLAGPVVVAAVILPRGMVLAGVRDSKEIPARAREAAYVLVRERAVAWSAWTVSPAEVDRRNVLMASLWGMERAVQRLRQPADFVLVDGHQVPWGLRGRARAVVKGDGRSQSIAAASIVAKVLRDRIMRAWDRHYPGYGFADHVGYPTAEHLQALRALGATPIHRRSFRPVAAPTQPELPFLFEEA